MHKWLPTFVATFLLGWGVGPVIAQYQGGPIKIGVMNDQSGLYSDIAGMGSVWTAKKAIEDFGAAAKGMKVEIIAADHLNKPDVGSNIARQWYDVEKVDAIVAPVSPFPAFRIGEKVDDPVAMYLSDIYTITGSLAGIPCMSVPCGNTPAGLPVGLQILTKHFDESTMFRVADGYERATN